MFSKPKPKVGLMIAIGDKPKGDMPPRPRSLEGGNDEQEPMDDEQGEAEEPEGLSVEERLSSIEASLAELLDYCRKDHPEPDGDEGQGMNESDTESYSAS